MFRHSVFEADECSKLHAQWYPHHACIHVYSSVPFRWRCFYVVAAIALCTTSVLLSSCCLYFRCLYCGCDAWNDSGTSPPQSWRSVRVSVYFWRLSNIWRRHLESVMTDKSWYDCTRRWLPWRPQYRQEQWKKDGRTASDALRTRGHPVHLGMTEH